MGKRRIINEGSTLTIYTERQQIEDLKDLARARQVSMAVVLREALGRFIGMSRVQREIAKARASEAAILHEAEAEKLARLKAKIRRGMR